MHCYFHFFVAFFALFVLRRCFPPSQAELKRSSGIGQNMLMISCIIPVLMPYNSPESSGLPSEQRASLDVPHEPAPIQEKPLPGPGRARSDMKKCPTRVRQPTLPQPGAAVLSATAGLTSEFGTGSGDPRLHGRTRGRHSHGSGRVPAPPWRLHGVPSRRTAGRGALMIIRIGRARAISSARLNGSPRLHLRPINLVVYQGPYQREGSSRRRLPA